MSAMTSGTLSFVDERQVPTVIQPMLPLHECADPTAAESVDEPLQSVAYSDAADDASTKTSCS